MQIEETDEAAHLPVYIHLCEVRATVRSECSKAANQYRRKRGNRKTPRKKKRGRNNPPKCDDCRDAGRAAGRADGPGQRYHCGEKIAELILFDFELIFAC